MVEKLPLDFVRKIYNLLTTGNDDVNFYCMCVQNQNREAATNSPIKFALNLIKINIMCRLPFTKGKIFKEEIGKSYLSELFVRPAICELASGMLDNSVLIADILGCAVSTIKSRDEIFELIEEETGVKGFATLRKQLADDNIPIKEIYKIISEKLCTVIDYKIELAEMEKYYVPNKYIIRLIDIAKCNNMSVTAVMRTSYPREFAKKILDKYKITPDKLLITCENGIDFKAESGANPHFTGILSCDYNGFIKKFMKYGCKPIYYRNPKTLMERAVHPDLSDEFCDIYDGLCGLRLFSGLKRMSREYEFSYICAAPAVFGFAQTVAQRADRGEKVICLCDESSIFGQVLKKICKSFENISFFPWSALASSKYRAVDKWKAIVKETPIFEYAESGIFDSFLRYHVSEAGNTDSLSLARIMATAWIDKSSDGVNNAVYKLIGESEKVVIADPVAGNCGSADFCSIIDNVKPDTIYKCLTMTNFLNCGIKNLKPLAKIVQGNKPLLCQIKSDSKRWIYSKKISRQKLGEIYKAISDFSHDFTEYTQNCKLDIKISGDDACSLYLQGLEQIRNII